MRSSPGVSIRPALAARPPSVPSLRHVALAVTHRAACKRFYAELPGMRVGWRREPGNIYPISGSDSLALHRRGAGFAVDGGQRAKHVGFALRRPGDVDVRHVRWAAHHVRVDAPLRTHRDGGSRFHCLDAGGNLVRMIYHPPIARDPA